MVPNMGPSWFSNWRSQPSRLGRDIEVHAEHVAWVVFGLERHEPVVVRTVGGAQHRLLLFTEPREVQVRPTLGEGLHRGKRLSRPRDVLVTRRWVGPGRLGGEEIGS